MSGKKTKQKTDPATALLVLQLRSLERRFARMEEVQTKNTQIFQETIGLMDIRQGLLVRKLRMSAVGLDWEAIFAEYAAAAALIQFCGAYRGWTHRREQAARASLPDNVVVFGGSP